MLDRIKVTLAASRSELAALVGAALAISLASYKMLESSAVSAECFPLTGKCFASITATSLGFKIEFIIIIFCAIGLVWLNYKKLRDSLRKTKIEPVGFFYDRVSEPGDPNKTIEYSLVEVRRTGNGGLEYRGVGRRPNSERPLEYRWRAREAAVKSSTDDVHKLFFRAKPGDIKFYSPRQRGDGTELPDTIVYNLGCIEYGMSDGKPEKLTGIFSITLWRETTWDADSLRRNHSLIDAS